VFIDYGRSGDLLANEKIHSIGKAVARVHACYFMRHNVGCCCVVYPLTHSIHGQSSH
jgi:hypothetical protein